MAYSRGHVRLCSSIRQNYNEDETDSEARDETDSEVPEAEEDAECIITDWPTNKRRFGSPSDSKQPIKHKKLSDEVAGPSSRKSILHSMEVDKSARLPAIASSLASKTMLNELVLEKVAQRLPAAELFKLRQTCTSWNRCFAPELQKTYSHPISLHNVPGRHGGKLAMKSYTNLIQRSAGVPFTHYKLYDSTQAPLQDFKDFFSICGGHISNLSLDSHSVWEEGVNVDKIRQIIFQLAPELRSLTIKTDADEEAPTWNKRQKSKSNKTVPNLRRLNLVAVGDLLPAYKNLLISILQSAVNLDAFSLEDGSNECNMKVVSCVREHMPRLDNLNCLHMYDLRAPELRVLSELARRKDRPLRLQSFCTSLFYRLEQHRQIAELFYPFLNSQAPTLQNFELELDGYTRTGDAASWRTVSVPPMPSLQKFKLVRHGLNRAFVRYKNNTLENTFPQLKHFTYNLLNRGQYRVPLEEEIVIDDRMRSTHAHLKNLALDVALDATTFERFGSVLPSVTRLQLELMPDTIGLMDAVWTLWPALVSLEIKITSSDSSRILNLDEVLTGILVSKYKTLKKQLDSAPGTLTHDRARALLSEHKTKPGISYLTQLQRFSLKLEGSAFEITDISGSFGFAMANPTLQYMVVEGPRVLEHGRNPTNRISAECRAFIKSAFHPFAVIEV